MDFLDKINLFTDICKMQILEPVLKNYDLIKKIIFWLEDTSSKTSYENMIAFQVLRHLITREKAIEYVSEITTEQFDKDRAITQKMRDEGKLPYIEMWNMEYGFTNYIYVITFLYEQYKYAPYVEVQEGDIFLDCGGCSGETALWAAINKAKKVYTFEPSSENKKYIKKNIKNNNMENIIEHIPLAIGNTTGFIYFEESQDNPGAAHQVFTDTQSTIKVPVTTLDIWCEENNIIPTFIKMDIEGAEMLALKGAENIIKEFKPKLTICLYHSLSDMWEIPAFIKKICPEYKFWGRKNAHTGEYVLYANIK